MTRKIADPSQVLDAARAWIGTAYVHQASCLGAGSDCLGLIRGIWRSLHGSEPQAVPAYSKDWAEPQRDEVLLKAALRHLVPVPSTEDLTPSQVLLFRMKDVGVAKHLGVCSRVLPGSDAWFIHAYSGHAVTESPLSAPWRRRIAARFYFPKGIK